MKKHYQIMKHHGSESTSNSAYTIKNPNNFTARLIVLLTMMVMMAWSNSALAQTVTATWDWKTAGTVVDEFTKIEGTTGSILSDQSGISLTIDATNGGVYDNGNNIAIKPNTVISVPVTSTNDIVIVENYSGYTGYKVGDQAPTNNFAVHHVTDAEASAKKVDITVTSAGQIYFHSIKVFHNTIAKKSYTAVWNWNQASPSASLQQKYQNNGAQWSQQLLV